MNSRIRFPKRDLLRIIWTCVRVHACVCMCVHVCCMCVRVCMIYKYIETKGLSEFKNLTLIEKRNTSLLLKSSVLQIRPLLLFEFFFLYSLIKWSYPGSIWLCKCKYIHTYIYENSPSKSKYMYACMLCVSKYICISLCPPPPVFIWVSNKSLKPIIDPSYQASHNAISQTFTLPW